LRIRSGEKKRCQEEENGQSNFIRSAHSNPSWRRP
jgi:hypothetical protein